MTAAVSLTEHAPQDAHPPSQQNRGHINRVYITERGKSSEDSSTMPPKTHPSSRLKWEWEFHTECLSQLQSVKRQYSKTSRLAKASLNFLPIEHGPELALHESKIVHCTERRPDAFVVG